MYLFAVIAVGVACYFANTAWRNPRPAVILAATLWLLYAALEVAIAVAYSNERTAVIRADIFVTWPTLAVASFFASKRPGKWSARSKVVGFISIGGLLLSLGLIAGIFLDGADVFQPARRDCKARGERAVQACDEAIRQSPGAAFLHYHRALAHRAKGDLDRALADLNVVIEHSTRLKLDPSREYTGRGVIYLEKGDVERALADFNAANRTGAIDGAAFFMRGTISASRGELNQALEDFTQFIEMRKRGAVSPQDPFAPSGHVMFDSRGLVHLRLGNLDKAMADYDDALKLDPKFVGSLYGRGLAKIKLGDKVGGDADIAAAIAIKAGIAEEYAKLGVK